MHRVIYCVNICLLRYGGGGFGARDYRQNQFRSGGGGGGGMHGGGGGQRGGAPGAPHGAAPQQHSGMFQAPQMIAFPSHYGGGYGGNYTNASQQGGGTDWWGS